ncbi:hypothetical protein BEP19_13610 [Ammoniphilus oxalaticus]|uniref:Uncharacterized protein n=1 Tax=Ammoniphilus oxalaticus TaxID=66863 RepID=A0A419SEF5_9BACL|nr:hypothetical protein [Ammoniphilus oxalaticus]RKD21671.1 hypothetical protein BEP19_13610 [Ammoniphilus oxalaticus]
MSSDFIRVKALEGELKLSQVKSRFGCSITTKELVFQKPHQSYQIQLSDIISMKPHHLEARDIAFAVHTPRQEPVIATFEKNYYLISAEKVTIYNRNGVFEKGQTQVIAPLSQKILEHIACYSNLTVF